MTFSIVPAAIDAPWNYDEEGNPKSPELAQHFVDQKEYVAAVKREESRMGEDDHFLSGRLEDSRRQQLATAMRLCEYGKIGRYSRLVDEFISGTPAS